MCGRTTSILLLTNPSPYLLETPAIMFVKENLGLLLYVAEACPYAARAKLALEHSGLPYDTHQIDVSNKPSWYVEKINAAGKGKFGCF